VTALEQLSWQDVLVPILLGVSVLVSLGAGHLASERLRDHHQALWRDLGQPAIVGSTTLSMLRFTSFVLRRRYRKVGDSTLSTLCRLLYVPMLLGLLLGVAAAAAAAAFAVLVVSSMFQV
jgi:hypothetical protein